MFLIAVDESYSGDSSIDLFADEQLLRQRAHHFKPIIRAWSVPTKPKTEPKKAVARNGLQSPSGLSDSALPLKTPTDPISIQAPTTASTTENITEDHSTTSTPAVMNNLKVSKPKQQTIIKKIEEVSNAEASTPQAQNISVKSSNLSQVTTAGSLTTSVASVTTTVPTTTENITKQTTEKETSVPSEPQEDASQTVKPLMESVTPEMVTLGRITPSPAPHTPPATTTKSHLDTFTVKILRSTSDTRVTTMDTSQMTESKTDSSTNILKTSPTHTATSMAPLMTTTTPTTTTSTSKPGQRKYSITWDEEEGVEEKMEETSVVKTVVEENFKEKPAMKSGRWDPGLLFFYVVLYLIKIKVHC